MVVVETDFRLKNLATVAQPTPYGCITDTSTDRPLRICSGYTTPGLPLLSSEDSLDCGNSLANDDSESDFNKCPIRIAPKHPLAHRAQCHNSSVVLSSQHPLQVRIYCDNLSKRPIKLENFPVYLNTDCEIRLLDKRAETILLPQLTTKFIQDQDLDVIPVTLTPKLIPTTRTANLSPSTTTEAESTLDSNDSETSPLQEDVSTTWYIWGIPTLATTIGVLGIALMTFICCYCSKYPMCAAALNKCKPACCDSSQSSEQSKSCLNCFGSKPAPPPVTMAELIENLRQRYPTAFTPTEQELRSLMPDYKPPPPAPKPSAPSEIEDSLNEPNHITVHKELSKSINNLTNNLTEARNLINNQFATASQNQTPKA